MGYQVRSRSRSEWGQNIQGKIAWKESVYKIKIVFCQTFRKIYFLSQRHSKNLFLKKNNKQFKTLMFFLMSFKKEIFFQVIQLCINNGIMRFLITQSFQIDIFIYFFLENFVENSAKFCVCCACIVTSLTVFTTCIWVGICFLGVNQQMLISVHW